MFHIAAKLLLIPALAVCLAAPSFVSGGDWQSSTARSIRIPVPRDTWLSSFKDEVINEIKTTMKSELKQLKNSKKEKLETAVNLQAKSIAPLLFNNIDSNISVSHSSPDQFKYLKVDKKDEISSQE